MSHLDPCRLNFRLKIVSQSFNREIMNLTLNLDKIRLQTYNTSLNELTLNTRILSRGDNQSHHLTATNLQIIRAFKH